MIPTQVQLFSYTDLPLVAPWLTEKICLSLMAAGLFTPRLTQRAPDADVPYFSLYDLIALTSVQQLLRSGIRSDVLQTVLHAPSNYRYDGTSEDGLGFLSTGELHGQELSLFLEANHAEVTILVRHFLEGGTDIEFIPNDLLGAKDFRGITLTGVECKAIRDAIKSNIDAWATGKSVQSDGHDSLQA